MSVQLNSQPSSIVPHDNDILPIKDIKLLEKIGFGANAVVHR